MSLSDTLFPLIQEAIWLLDEQDQVLLKTEAATRMESQYVLALEKVLDIAHGRGCLLHSTKAVCLDCPVGVVDATGFPFVLKDASGELYDFWGSLQQSEETGQQLLQLTPQRGSHGVFEDHSLFDYLNDAREKERKQIAQDLHDGIAQSIYSLMLETRGLKWLPTEEQPEQMKRIDRHFAEVLQEVKELAGELRPMTLDEFGLEPALRQFAQRTLEMTGFEVVLQQIGTPQPVSEARRIAIYRVVQEAVANALKYAGVNQVQVILDYQADYMAVTIKDDGAGFILSEQAHGYGLANMKERITAVGGTLSIHTALGSGTEILIRLDDQPEKAVDQDELGGGADETIYRG